MYAYYLLAALGPKYQKYIWWKQHMTTIQMVQFVAIMAHSFQLVRGRDIFDYFSPFFSFAKISKNKLKTHLKNLKLRNIEPNNHFGTPKMAGLIKVRNSFKLTLFWLG